MIAIALAVAVIAATAFVVVVAGIQATDRRARLHDPLIGDGFADRFARKFLGVYIRNPEDNKEARNG